MLLMLLTLSPLATVAAESRVKQRKRQMRQPKDKYVQSKDKDTDMNAKSAAGEACQPQPTLDR